jgi:hypothetical protein
MILGVVDIATTATVMRKMRSSAGEMRKSKMKSTGESGAIGENYVICELLRYDFIPLISPNPAQRDWDIVVYENKSLASLKVQVKTVSWPKEESKTKAVVTGNFASDFDFLVIVVINFPDCNTPSYCLYVIPKSDLESSDVGGLPSKDGEKLKFKNKTIPFSTFPKAQQVLDKRYTKWDEIKKLLTLRSSGTVANAPAP